MAGRSTSRWAGGVVVAGYALAAWLVFWPLSLLSRTRIVSCACTDPAQQVWFLALGRAEVASGHLSLFTRMADYPTGANLLANTSMLLLGWMSAPLTALSGPIATYNLLCRLALFLSAWACYYALRKVGVGRVGAALGGLLYGFSPYMFEQGGLHLFIMFVPLPPLMMMLVYRHLALGGDRRQTVRRGILLGLLAVAQFLISGEILVTTTVMTLTVLAVLALAGLLRRRFDSLREARRRTAGLAAVVALAAGPWLLLAAAYALHGPEALDKRTVPKTVGVHWSNILLPINGAEVLGRLLPVHSPKVSWYGDVALVGLPLVAVAVVTVVRRRRQVLVQAAAILLVVAWLLSIGPGWGYHRKGTVPIDWAPLRLIWHLPVLQDIMPNRLTLYTFLGAAVLVAVAVDALVSSPAMTWRGIRDATDWARVGGMAAVILAVAVDAPWGSAAPADSAAADISAAAALRHVPAGTTVLTYPYGRYLSDQPMLWQAIDRLRFRLLGGYLLQPGPRGQTEGSPEPLRPDAVPILFEDAQFRYPRIRSDLVRQAQLELPELVHRYGISTVVVDLDPVWDGTLKIPDSRTRLVVRLVSEVFGPPHRVGTYDIWDVAVRHRVIEASRLDHAVPIGSSSGTPRS